MTRSTLWRIIRSTIAAGASAALLGQALAGQPAAASTPQTMSASGAVAAAAASVSALNAAAAADEEGFDPEVDIGTLNERPSASRRLLLAGDSITQGSSGDYTWRYRLWKKLQDTAPGQVGFVGTQTTVYDNVNNVQGSGWYGKAFAGSAHAATWGTTLATQVNQVNNQVSTTNANTLVVMLGINDILWLNSTPSQLKSQFRTYIQRARNAKAGIDIVLCQVLSRYDVFTQQYLQQSTTATLATELANLATEMDTSSERVVVANTLTGWDPKVHTWDGTHPNSTGETLIAQRVSVALQKFGLGTTNPNIFTDTPWTVRSSAPLVGTSPEKATVTWDRTSTGATGMYLEYNLTNFNDGFQRLPYAVSEQDYWTLNYLVAGGDYKFRTVPVKGSMTGRPSLATLKYIPAQDFDRSVPWARAVKSGGTGMSGRWGSAANASGYLLGYRKMAFNPDVTTLPYPVESSVGRWDISPLFGGWYYQFRVKPVRGLVEGTWTNSDNMRTDGIAGGRAYIALGDSYSSGLGAKEQVSGYDLDQPCRRTSEAWAFRMQPQWNSATRLVACQGDTKDGGIDGGVYAQLSEIYPFFASRPNAPQLVTVTVGGNDVLFAEKLRSCIFGNCATNENEIAWYNEAVAQAPELRNFYDALRDAAPNADILVGGYPEVLQVDGGLANPVCSVLTASERDLAARLSGTLNGVMYQAADGSDRRGNHTSPVWSAGFHVAQAFRGHGACQDTANEWIHSYTFGGGIGGVTQPYGMNSFHPKSSGQSAYAVGFSNALLERTGG